MGNRKKGEAVVGRIRVIVIGGEVGGWGLQWVGNWGVSCHVQESSSEVDVVLDKI